MRLLGIRTSKLSDESEPEQISIFDLKPPEEPDEKHKRLKKAMDELNARFGDGAVVKASRMKKDVNTLKKGGNTLKEESVRGNDADEGKKL